MFPSQGGTSRKSTPEPEPPVRLFQICGSHPTNSKAIEVPALVASLNSNDVFLLKSQSGIYLWYGKVRSLSTCMTLVVFYWKKALRSCQVQHAMSTPTVLIMDIIGKAVLSSIYNLSGVQWWWKGHGKGGGLLYWSRLIRGDHGWGTGAKWVLGNLRWKRTICKWQKVHRTLFVLQDSKQSQKMVQKLSMGQYPYVRE